MNMQYQIPAEITVIIEAKRQEIAQQRQAEQAEKQKAEQEAVEKGKQMYDAYISGCLQKVPQWLHQYLKMPVEEIQFERIGKGWDRANMDLYFSVPGLSEIQFRPEKDEWRAASARAGYLPSYGEDGREPYMTLRDEYFKVDLESVLVHARDNFEKHLSNIELYSAGIAEQEQRRQQYLEEEQDRIHESRDVEKAEREAKEHAEEQALFDAIKNDAIAIHMLKAFVLLRDERSAFEQQLYEADENMSSIEYRWSRRAEELRRQADDAQRRADDEKYRLQNDLDDAEAKLKKAQRGW